MKTDKEYPATHSMSTAWYFVDDDNNVALFSFGENGPIPEAVTIDNWMNSLCFIEPYLEKNGVRYLNWTDSQVMNLISRIKKTEITEHYLWTRDFCIIDMNKKAEFIDYLAEQRSKHEIEDKDDDTCIPYCMSEALGIYIVNFNSFAYGDGKENIHFKHLHENGIVTEYAKVPDLDFADYKAEGIDDSCPYYIYMNDNDPAIPHDRISMPECPIKLEQLPERLREKVIRLGLKFSDNPKILISKEWPCFTNYTYETEIIDGVEYVLAYLPSNEEIYVLNKYRDIDNKDHPLSMTVSEIKKYKAEKND